MRLASLARITFVATVIFFLMSVVSTAQSNSRYVKQIPGNQSVIVFVHGIFGDSISTWTSQNGAYWPSLLSSDSFFSSYDIYVYEYPSRFFGGNFSIDEIADNMRLLFDADEILNYNDIIFVSHSMGGLATRAYLNKNRDAAARVRLAYFYSTPTTGSELASIATLINANPQLAKMRSMQSSDYLADLQRQWLSINFKIPSFCAYETQKTYGVNVVTQTSASNLCNRRLDPIDGDHITIVKPADNRDTAYLALKTAIQQTVGKSQLLGTPSVEDGEKVFRDCKPCHTLAEGKNRVGPNLYHIVGRKAGTVEGFAYSNAMKHAGIIWNEKNLKEFLAKPMWFIAGNKMAFAGIKQENELNNLIAYLKEVASAP